MIHPVSIHPQHCRCTKCAPRRPSVRPVLSPGNRIGLLLLAGMAVGVAIGGLLDLVHGTHGVAAMFGF